MAINKRKLLIIVLSLILLISSFASFTYASKIISTYGYLRTDGVDITISSEQYATDLAPNMTVPYKPIISYKGVDAYIRFTLDISNEFIKQCTFSGLNENWVKKGEYYYYTKPVHHEDEIETFKSFLVPADWSELEPPDFMNSNFNITALCDAVQAENFTPDFGSETPWGELEIEYDNDYDGSQYNNDYQITKNIPIEMNLKGSGSYSLSSNTMANQSILPGDTYKNSIILKNIGKHNIDVFFNTSEMPKTEEDNLLDALQLKIYLDGKEYYEGTLRAASLNKWDNLLEIKKGETHEMSYEIYAPKELDNAYQIKEDSFIWNFKYHDIPDAPKTGDSANLLIWLIIATISGASLYYIIKKRKA